MARNEDAPYIPGMSKLNEKVAVVTGGSSGIGLAIARRFVAEGAHVFITGRRQAELDAAVKLIERNVTAVQGDASNLEDLDRLYAQVKKEKGKVDIVVANAGMTDPMPFAEATPEHFDRIFDLNVRGAFFTVQKSLPLLSQGGSIVAVGSAMTTKGLPAYATYSASKAALRSFTRTWASELKGRGIRANTLSPGGTDTPLLIASGTPDAEAEKMRQLYSSWIPLGRLGRPEEIAAAALFLASSESSYATGTDLVVDGGFTQV